MWDALIDANGALYVRLMREEIAIVDQPYKPAEAADARIDAQNGYPATLDHILVAILMPSLRGVIGKKFGIDAEAEVTVAAANVFLYRARHRRLPDTLAEAMSPAPTDPYDLRPLPYRREGSGFVVYSVGPSLAYDGGPLRPKEVEAVFRYPARPSPEAARARP
jgi:hypothetical protein